MSARYPQSSQLGSATSSAPRNASPVLRPVINILRRPLNPLIRALAGSRTLRVFAVVHHQGRRSGRAYATPVSARPVAGGFIIPLTFGEESDWFQNLRAAGGGVIRWNGAEYAVVDPVVVDLATARVAFSSIERAIIPLLGIERFVRVLYATAGEHDTARNIRATPDEPTTGQEPSRLPDTRAQHEIAS